MIDILFFYFLMSSLFVFGKTACIYFSPLQLTSVRLLSIGLIFLVFSLVKRHISWKRVVQHRILFAGMAASAITSDIFRFVSLTVIPSSHSALVATTSPLIAAVISYLVFKEYITFQKAAALALGILGILPLMLHNFSLLPVSSTDIIIKGYGAAFLATIGFVAVGVFIKKLGEEKYPLFTTLGIGLTLAGLFCLLLGLTTQVDFYTAYYSYGSYLPVIVLPSIVGYPLFAYLVCAYPLTLVAFAQLSSPLWTVIISLFHGKNDISIPFIISFCVLATAFILFYAQEIKNRRALRKKP